MGDAGSDGTRFCVLVVSGQLGFDFGLDHDRINNVEIRKKLYTGVLQPTIPYLPE